ncbi:NAD-dependent epimerase/dehydratase family protein, partial [Candidatus Parcubacteria bacterium]
GVVAISCFGNAVAGQTASEMRVLVTGATSMIGDFLLPMLVDAGHEVVATSRRERETQQGVDWHCLDLVRENWFHSLGRVDAWINLTAISLLDDNVERALAHLRPQRLIVFSSTSRFTKRYAHGEQDRGFAEQLMRGEERVERICRTQGASWHIIRPTMIYCLGRDKNLTLILRFIRRFRVFPLVGSGGALRQPVHAEDLAWACRALLDRKDCADKAYVLSGGEVLTYREMVSRLFAKLGLRPRFVRVPVMLLRMLIGILHIFPHYRYLTMDMADRMDMDMVFSHDEAARDFGYAPRPFRP